ncbi:MAG: rhomboid-like protein [Mycobacterium sp.]
MLSWLSRLKVTLILAAALAAVAFALLHFGPKFEAKVIRSASTNLHNLGEGRIGTLISSAFVNPVDSIQIWLPGVVAVLALGELLWHSRRLRVAFAVGHIGATLLVAAGLAAVLALGLQSHSIVDVADVGMSYGVIGVLGTFTAAIRRRWRAAWTGWWLAVALGSAVLDGGDFTAVGHALALILGMGVGTRFAQPVHWTLTRYLLLVMAGGFGYLLIAAGQGLRTVVAIGLLGAALAQVVSVIWKVVALSQPNSSALASIQSDSHV